MRRLGIGPFVGLAGVIAATGSGVMACSVVVSTEGLAGGSAAEGADGSQREAGALPGDGAIPTAPTKADGGQVGPPSGSGSGSSGGSGSGSGSSSGGGSGGADASAPDTGGVDPSVDAGPPDTGAPTTCSTGRARVFVTSTFHNPNFGGIAGGDAICQKTADGAQLGNKWRAWLADPTTAAVSHVYAASKGYVLVDGTVVATSINQLISPPLTHAIDRTETGATVTDGQTEVWTGYDPAANTYVGTCNDGGGDWTSTNVNASTPFVGHLDALDDTWSAAYLQSCDRTNVRLYCFEVCP